MTIQYLNALAGAGKTRALVRYAKQLAQAGESVLFIQPSKLLIDNTLRTEIGESDGCYEIKAIHSGATDNVIKSIVQHATATPNRRGRILFITHEAFMRLPYIDRRSQWHLLFDEVPAVDLFEAINVPHTHHIVTDLIELVAHDAAYGRLVARDATALNEMARNHRDDRVWRLFSDLANRITSKHWQVYALQSNYHSLVKNERTGGQLLTHSLLQPSIFMGFKQTIIASALFESSCLYQLWLAQGVDLKPVDEGLCSALRYRTHENGSLITISYVTEVDWSKTLRDKQTLEGVMHSG